MQTHPEIAGGVPPVVKYVGKINNTEETVPKIKGNRPGQRGTKVPFYSDG
jgi:hypothetical protein